MADLIPAIWNGPFDGQRVDGSTLRPGDEAQVTEADLLSAHWARKVAAPSLPPAKPATETVKESD